MKTMNAMIGLLALGLISSTSLAQGTPAVPSAETPTQKREQVIEKREQNQEKRIQEGEKSGQLNGKEAQKLENEQAKIKKMEQKAEADGKVTKGEMKRIEKVQDRASDDIRRKKHNKKHNG